MTEPGSRPDGIAPGLVLVAADAAAGWFLYDAVGPVGGLVLWAVAALVVFGLLVDGAGRPLPVGERSTGPSSGTRE